MHVEGHLRTTTWIQAIQEATRKYNRFLFRRDHFQYDGDPGEHDFYAGSLEYGWTKLNPMQEIQANCKEA